MASLYERKQIAWEKIYELSTYISPEIWNPLLELIYEIKDIEGQEEYIEGLNHGRASILV